MVLRYDRRSAHALAHGSAGDAGGGFTVTDVGRSLSRERTRQGLSLRDVSGRTGIPLEQLRAAETGALDRPDGLATLKTVRRYADFLGLPGDRYALAILEHWPTKGGVHPLSSGYRTGQADQPTGPTAAIPATGAARGDETGRVSRASAGEEPTGAIAAWRQPEPTDTGARRDPYSYGDTGVTPAVPASSSQVWSRPRRRSVTVLLQALVGVISLAVLAGIALLAIDRLHPSWLRHVGLTSAAAPATPASHPRVRTDRRAHASAGTAATAVVVRARPSSGGAAVFDVPASSYTVKVSALGGPCWVDVTSKTAPSPLYTGIIAAGSSHSFSGAKTLAVEFGSVSGRISVSAPGVRSTPYQPPTVPYTVTVRPHR